MFTDRDREPETARASPYSVKGVARAVEEVCSRVSDDCPKFPEFARLYELRGSVVAVLIPPQRPHVDDDVVGSRRCDDCPGLVEAGSKRLLGEQRAHTCANDGQSVLSCARKRLGEAGGAPCSAA